MINLNQYSLSRRDKRCIQSYLEQVGNRPSLQQIWSLMDQAWARAGCDQGIYQEDRYREFYSDPIWLLNGIYIEQDATSMAHRHSIAAWVAFSRPDRVLDYGGGFGTLARLLAEGLPGTEIYIFEPFPPAHGLQACRNFRNINYIINLKNEWHDALVCTDVLEYVHDPLLMLRDMVATVKPGGHLYIANCFHPVILCHLPCTFHLNYLFDWCAAPLGLQPLGPCTGSHARIYRRHSDGKMNLGQARRREAIAKLLHPLLTWLAIPARTIIRWIRALPVIVGRR